MCMFSGGDLSGRLWVAELPNAHSQRIPRHWLEPNRGRALFVFPPLRCLRQWLVEAHNFSNKTFSMAYLLPWCFGTALHMPFIKDYRCNLLLLFVCARSELLR